MTDHEIAIAHKDYDVRGGGEVVAEELADTFDAPLYVGRRNTSNEPSDTDPIEIPLTRWQRRCIDHGGAPRSLAYWIAWQNASQLNDYDTVITSGNEPLWHVGRDDQVKIAYTHSTPRWQYDLAHKTGDGVIGTIYRTAVRTLYQHNITRPDLYAANSDLVARRIRKYWNIPSEQIRVVYPPVPTHEYSPDARQTSGYYLYLGRLARNKQVDDVVEAFNHLNQTVLKIAGKGPEKQRLERMAGDNIHFEGYVSEAEKQKLYAGAKALVYPAQNEDFGMVPIEAMASGTPVIGVNEGFTQYQIQDGRNGLTYDRSPSNLYTAIQHFERAGVEWTEQRIARFADRFGVEQFRTGMREAVADARERAQVSPDWQTHDGNATTPQGAPQQPPVRPDGGDN